MDTAPGLAENTTLIGQMWHEGRELQAENERLREALAEWLAADDAAEVDFTSETERRLDAAMAAARAALGA